MLEESPPTAVTWIGNMAYTPAQVDALYDAIKGGDEWPDLDGHGPFSREIQIITTDDILVPGTVFLDLSVTQMYNPPSVPTIMRVLHGLRHLNGSVADNPLKMDELFLELSCDMVNFGAVYYDHVQQTLNLIVALNNYLGINRLVVDMIEYINEQDMDDEVIERDQEPSYSETLTVSNLFQFTVKPIHSLC